MKNAKFNKRKKDILFIVAILFLIIFSYFLLPDTFHERVKQLVPFTSKKSIKNVKINWKKVDIYLPQLIKFHLSSRIFTPLKYYIQKAYLDSSHINPDSLEIFIHSLDSLDADEVEIFYKKYMDILDTISVPESIKVKIPKEAIKELFPHKKIRGHYE